MDFSKIPFTLYDLFGYLASGILGISAFIYFFDYWMARSWRLASLNWVLTIIAAYVLGHILSSLSKWLYELVIVGKWLRYPSTNLFKEGKIPKIKKIFFPEYYVPFPKNIRDKFPNAGNPAEKSALFYEAYAKITSKKDVLARLDTFLILYGFCRTISFTLLAISVLIFIKGPWIPGFFCLASAIFMFLRYLKFFRQYSYTLFLSAIDTSANIPKEPIIVYVSKLKEPKDQ